MGEHGRALIRSQCMGSVFRKFADARTPASALLFLIRAAATGALDRELCLSASPIPGRSTCFSLMTVARPGPLSAVSPGLTHCPYRLRSTCAGCSMLPTATVLGLPE